MRLQLPLLPPLNDLSPASPLTAVGDPSAGANAALKFISRNSNLIPDECKDKCKGTPLADVASHDDGHIGEKDAFMRFISRNLYHLQNLPLACDPSEEEELLRSAAGVSTFSLQADVSANTIVEPPTRDYGYDSEYALTGGTSPREVLLLPPSSSKTLGQTKELTACSPTESGSTASELSPLSSDTSRSSESNSTASEPSPRQTYRECWEECEMKWEESSDPFCLL